MSTVYVLVDEHGDYSDYTKHVIKVFSSKQRAEAEAVRLNSLRDERIAANNVLYKQYEIWHDVVAVPQWAIIKALKDSVEARVNELVGYGKEGAGYPYPKLSHWYDVYHAQEEAREINNQESLIGNMREEYRAKIRAEMYPQFMEYVSENYDDGYFMADQEYLVEEHEFDDAQD